MVNRESKPVSETPATAWLRRHGIAFTAHVYDYVEHGGTAESALQLGLDEHTVVKTLVIGGTSPFGFKREGVPVYVQASVLVLPRICINGGRRGFLVGIEAAVLTRLLGATPVDCALAAA